MFLGLNQEQWVGVGAIAAAVLALVAAWLTLLTARTARGIARATDAAEKSSVAAARAARESADAATDSRRRTEEPTRAEAPVPVLYAWATGVDSTPEASTFSVRYTNIGEGVALNVVLRIREDDTTGPPVPVRFPVVEGRGLPSPAETAVPHPRGGATLDGPYAIEAVYQDGLGRRLATRTHHDGTVDCYRITNAGGPGRYERVVAASRDVPPGIPSS